MKNNGGAAFPGQKEYTDCHGYKTTAFEGGMSIRDRFVIAAMESGDCPFKSSQEHQEAARWCGHRADAMIKERQES